MTRCKQGRNISVYCRSKSLVENCVLNNLLICSYQKLNISKAIFLSLTKSKLQNKHRGRQTYTYIDALRSFKTQRGSMEPLKNYSHQSICQFDILLISLTPTKQESGNILMYRNVSYENFWANLHYIYRGIMSKDWLLILTWFLCRKRRCYIPVAQINLATNNYWLPTDHLMMHFIFNAAFLNKIAILAIRFKRREAAKPCLTSPLWVTTADTTNTLHTKRSRHRCLCYICLTCKMSFKRFNYKSMQSSPVPVADLGEGPGDPPPLPHLIFRPNWGPKSWKNFLRRLGPPFLRVWMTALPPPPPHPHLKVWIWHWVQ